MFHSPLAAPRATVAAATTAVARAPPSTAIRNGASSVVPVSVAWLPHCTSTAVSSARTDSPSGSRAQVRWVIASPPPNLGEAAQMLLQIGGVGGRVGAPVVVEVGEDLGTAAPGRDPPPPAVELRLRVVPAASARPAVKADQRPVGGQKMRLKRPLGVIADHQRGAVAAQQVEDRALEPAGVAELECVPGGRQLLQGRGEPFVVAVEAFRELPENRAELAGGAQRLDPLEEAPRPHTCLAQALHVAHVAACLDAEQESGRRLLRPGLRGVQAGQAIEGRVELDRRETACVISEPPGGRRPLGIEAAAPVAVAPSGAADPDLLQPALTAS